ERPLGRLTLRAHLDANYADATQTIDQSAIKNDSAFLVNGRLTLADIPLANGGTIAVSAWARNLLDEEYVYRRDELSAHQVGDYGNFNAPRTFGVEMKAAF